MTSLVKVFKVLSDESRLRVLNLLLERECCVCEVMQVLKFSQSKASRILSALFDAGFLKLRKEGLWSLYCVDYQGMTTYLRDITEANRKAFTGSQQMKQDRENLRMAERLAPCCLPVLETETPAAEILSDI